MEVEKPTTSNQEEVGVMDSREPHGEKDWINISHEAQLATQAEHAMGLMAAFRAYPKAIRWSIFVSLACIMEGYDTAFIGSLYAEPTFQRDFGVLYQGGYQITAAWQTALSLSSSIGIIIGILMNGYLAERFGMKRTMLVSYVAITALTFILVFAQSLPVILVGQILCGIPWGIFNTTAPSYASEVCPVALRGYLTTFINLTWIIGQLISAGVLRGVQGMSNRWAYDIPFAIQWVWPVPLFIGMFFCPETPWWLLRKDRLEDAERSLKRLSDSSSEDIKNTLAMMIHTDHLESKIESGSYLDCFRGVDRRRTEIAFCTWGIQILSGLPLQSYNTYFFEQAGLSTEKSFDMSIAYYVIGFCGTILSWFLITWFGRRWIFISGLILMTLVMFIIGFVSLAPSSNLNAEWAEASLLVVWVFLYDITVGPLAFCIVSEVSATRLRGKTIAIGRNSFYLWNIVFSVAAPYMLNPTEDDWKGKCGFLFGGTALLSTIWAYFRLPELKGRTYEELDVLFRKRVPAKDFANYKVDPYDPETVREVLGSKEE